MAPIALDPPASQAPSVAAARPTHGNGYSTTAPAIDPTAARRPVEAVTVESPNLTYTDEALLAKYTFHSAQVEKNGDSYKVKPVEQNFEFKTIRAVPKTGSVFVVSRRRRRRSVN